MKKKWGTGLIYDKTETMCTELNKRAEAATCSYSATGNFFTIYCVCDKESSEDPIKAFSS